MKRPTLFFQQDKTIIASKVKEAFTSVAPVTLIVLILCFTLTPIDSGVFLAFLFGALLVIVGIGLFTLGADTAMTPIGEYIGTSIIKTKKLYFIIPAFLIIGVFITVAEPDLQVLAEQLKATINPQILTYSVGVGVGVFLVIALLRVVLKIKLKYVLFVCYTAVFIMAFLSPETFIPLSFDSGGVTTGPMSVPFILAMGAGVSGIRSDKDAESDGFGFTALCSVGPIMAVMILGLIYKPTNIDVSTSITQEIVNSKDLISYIGHAFPKYLMEVGISLLPIIAFFLLCMIFGQRFSKKKFIKILIGLLYTYIGLVFFMVGVNSGFLSAGSLIGEILGSSTFKVLAVPIGFILGFFVVGAEPAVYVLNKQVYEITGGKIPKKALKLSLMVGVGISVALAMLRILLHINILYFLVPAYAVSIVLMFFTPDLFTAIAFDSGGVASGAMTASFLLPFALGLCSVTGGNLATEGFGLVAFVAMTPLIAIQILGIIYKYKLKKHNLAKSQTPNSEDIID